MREFLPTFSAIAATAVLAAWAAPASAATMLDVQRSETCGKTTCFDSAGLFTKTWSAKDAAGPLTVGKLLLDRGVLGSLDGSTFRLSFTLNGKEVGAWGNYMMAAIAGEQLTFSGQAFTWNPEDGDLMLVLEIAKPATGGSDGVFMRAIEDARERDQQVASDAEGDFEMEAIVPGMIETDVSAVPEPATWALMISGFGLAGASLRRNRADVVAGLQPIR